MLEDSNKIPFTFSLSDLQYSWTLRYEDLIPQGFSIIHQISCIVMAPWLALKIRWEIKTPRYTMGINHLKIYSVDYSQSDNGLLQHKKFQLQENHDCSVSGMIFGVQRKGNDKTIAGNEWSLYLLFCTKTWYCSVPIPCPKPALAQLQFFHFAIHH